MPPRWGKVVGCRSPGLPCGRRAAAPSTPRNPHIPCRPARHDRPKSGRGVQSVSGSAAAGRSGRRQHPGARCSLIYTINRRACFGRSPLLHGSRAHEHLFLITFTNGKGFWLGMAKQLVICELLNMQKDISDAVERCGRACVRGPHGDGQLLGQKAAPTQVGGVRDNREAGASQRGADIGAPR